MLLRAVTSLLKRNRLSYNRFHARLLSGSATNVQKSFIHKAEQKHNENMLVVEWKDESVSRFPYVYLRDLCTCGKCMDSSNLQRLTDTVAEVPLDIKTSKVTVSGNGEKIQIYWPDDHITEFPSVWLNSKKLLEKEERDQYFYSPNIARKGVKCWDKKDMQDKIPRFDYNSIMKDDKSLFEWLQTLHSVGIALIDEVPTSTDPVASENVCKRVGYIKTTHYGNYFDVTVKVDANNLTYTSHELLLHCDLPYLEYYPGLQFLHCLQQVESEGGTNYFADGFHVAQQFKDSEPELFDLLCETSLPYYDIGKDHFAGDFHCRATQPVFEFDHTRKINRLAVNDHVRDYCLTDGATAEKVKHFYEAYTKMGLATRDPQNRIHHKLQPGEMVTFNSARVLHGRASYTPTGTGHPRHLQSCFLDWDLVYARLRALGSSLGMPGDW